MGFIIFLIRRERQQHLVKEGNWRNNTLDMILSPIKNKKQACTLIEKNLKPRPYSSFLG